MTRASPFSVRGRRALAITRDERDLSVLGRQLDRLGMTMTARDPDQKPPDGVFDVIILDADVIPAGMAWSAVGAAGIPVIVLVGTETPSRLKDLLELEPSGLLVKPLRSAGLYSTLVLAFDQARKRLETQRRLERLEDRVRARRVVLAAVLRVMSRRALSEPEAFAWIRRAAMERRTTIEQLSFQIMGSPGELPAGPTMRMAAGGPTA